MLTLNQTIIKDNISELNFKTNKLNTNVININNDITKINTTLKENEEELYSDLTYATCSELNGSTETVLDTRTNWTPTKTSIRSGNKMEKHSFYIGLFGKDGKIDGLGIFGMGRSCNSAEIPYGRDGSYYIYNTYYKIASLTSSGNWSDSQFHLNFKSQSEKNIPDFDMVIGYDSYGQFIYNIDDEKAKICLKLLFNDFSDLVINEFRFENFGKYSSDFNPNKNDTLLNEHIMKYTIYNKKYIVPESITFSFMADSWLSSATEIAEDIYQFYSPVISGDMIDDTTFQSGRPNPGIYVGLLSANYDATTTNRYPVGLIFYRFIDATINASTTIPSKICSYMYPLYTGTTDDLNKNIDVFINFNNSRSIKYSFEERNSDNSQKDFIYVYTEDNTKFSLINFVNHLTINKPGRAFALKFDALSSSKVHVIKCDGKNAEALHLC